MPKTRSTRRSPSPAKTSSSGTNTSSPKRASRQTSTTKLPGATKSKLLRAYLAVLAVFELPMLVGYTFLDNSLADGFSSNLTDAPPERRFMKNFDKYLSIEEIAE